MSKDFLSVSSGNMQGAFELLIKPDQMMPLQTETILVAPNKKIQRLWQKTYKGIEVVLSKDYEGYPLPGDFPLATRKLSQRLSKTQKPSKGRQER